MDDMSQVIESVVYHTKEFRLHLLGIREPLKTLIYIGVPWSELHL